MFNEWKAAILRHIPAIEQSRPAAEDALGPAAAIAFGLMLLSVLSFGKRAGAKQVAQKKKGKGARKSGNPAKAAQQAKADAEKKPAAANPFGVPGGEEIDYEKAAAELNLPSDFSKFLK